jgi:hypothetical protein
MQGKAYAPGGSQTPARPGAPASQAYGRRGGWSTWVPCRPWLVPDMMRGKSQTVPNKHGAGWYGPQNVHCELDRERSDGHGMRQGCSQRREATTRPHAAGESKPRSHRITLEIPTTSSCTCRQRRLSLSRPSPTHCTTAGTSRYGTQTKTRYEWEQLASPLLLVLLRRSETTPQERREWKRSAVTTHTARKRAYRASFEPRLKCRFGGG